MGSVINTNPDPSVYVSISDYSSHFGKDFEGEYLYFILYYDENGMHCSNFMYWKNVTNGFVVSTTEDSITAFAIKTNAENAYNYYSTCQDGGAVNYETGYDTIAHRFTFNRNTKVITLYSADGSVRWTSPAGLGYATNAYAVEALASWQVTLLGLINEDIPDAAPEMSAAYPAQYWRLDPNRNEGYPFHDLLPGVEGIDLSALSREGVITVYDLNEPQDGFKSNGLAVLEPLSCRSWQEKNGRWDLTLVHPLDSEWQKWKYLLAQNVLKVGGQLFRIDLQEPEISADRSSISVHAKHISYDLADERLGEITMPAGNAAQFLDFVNSSTLSKIGPFAGQYFTPYEFNLHTDISGLHEAVNWFNVSVMGTLIGEDSCFINTYGGELYRDNFYVSICSRMQYARDNAFRLRYSREIEYIKQTVDFSEFYTEIHAFDNFGNYYGNTWYDGTPSTWHWALHHAKPLVVKFNFDTSVDDNMQRLIDATAEYHKNINHPKTSYEIRVADMRRDPRYKDFPDFQELRIGDSGIVYVSELNVDDVQEITAIERDELTGEVLTIRLESLTMVNMRPSYMRNTVTSGKTLEDKQNAAMQRELKDARLKALPDWHSCRTYTWKELKQFKWKELKQHGI